MAAGGRRPAAEGGAGDSGAGGADALPRVAVVGRPNVGKSTLVNRVLGRRAAIVQELPGVTRDRVRYEAEWNGRRFEVVDTGGWEPHTSGLAARVAAQAELAMAEADLVLLVVDATVGATTEDQAVSELLRRGEVPVLLVANKVDSRSQESDAAALWSLGLGTPHAVSALHGRGSGDLLDEVVDRLPDAPRGLAGEDATPAIAIVGRPNVGKSSLFNKLAGSELAIVDPVPGTTRDTIDEVIERDGRAYRFVDTAGMRRAFARAQGADYYALVRSYQAIDRADVAVLVVDAADGVAEQDQKVAIRAVEAGAGLVVVCNKWDLVDADQRRELQLDIEHRLYPVKWAPMLRTSARTGRGVERLWPMLDAVVDVRSRRIPTGQLNQWLTEAVTKTPPPPVGGKSVRVKYVTEARTRPPEFVFFTTGPLTAAYRRFLEADLRRTFDFEGTPLRLVVRARPPRQPRGTG
jgi:GTP-binding protein